MNFVLSQLLHSFAQSDSWEIRNVAASNNSCPAEILTQLGCDKLWEVREQVAKNTHTPINILNTLLEDKDDYVQLAAGSNPKITTLDQHKPEQMPNTTYYRALAQNPNSSPNTLNMLANKPNIALATIIAVAQNPTTSPATLHTIVIQHAKHENTVSSVLQNPNCGVDTLKMVSENGRWNWGFQQQVAANPAWAETIIKNYEDPLGQWWWSGWLKNPNCTVSDLKKGAEGGWGMRLAVCENPNTPTELVEYLAKEVLDEIEHKNDDLYYVDTYWQILYQLGTHPNISAQTGLKLQMLLFEKNFSERLLASEPQIVVNDLLEKIADNLNNTTLLLKVEQTILRCLEATEDADIKIMLESMFEYVLQVANFNSAQKIMLVKLAGEQNIKVQHKKQATAEQNSTVLKTKNKSNHKPDRIIIRP